MYRVLPSYLWKLCAFILWSPPPSPLIVTCECYLTILYRVFFLYPYILSEYTVPVVFFLYLWMLYDNTVPSSFPLPMNATRLYCRITVVISFYLWMLSFSCTSTDDVGALVTEAGHVGHLFPRQLQQFVPFIIIRTWRTSQWRVHKQGEGVAMKPGW